MLLIGNYGVGNFGDEALREYFEQISDVQWQTVSHQVSETQLPRLPAGIRSFFRFDWLPTVRAIAAADAVVFGGGTLFTDTEAVRAGFIWWLHAVCCRLLGTPYYLAFQGIGPFRSSLSRFFARSAIRHAVGLSVRDSRSAERVRDLFSNKKVVQSFDPFYKIFKKRISNKSSDSIKNVFVIIPRNAAPDELIQAAKTALPQYPQTQVVIVSFQPDDLTEQAACRQLQTAFPGARLQPVLSTADLFESLSSACFAATSRYHGAISCLAAGIPFVTVSQAAGDKLDALSGIAVADIEDLIDAGELDLQDFLSDR